MAKDSSFDIVSEVDMQEIDNACGQATKELKQRYDLKDTGSRLELDKRAQTITVTAPSDFVAKQIIDIIQSKLIRRNVDIKSVQWGKVENASGGTVRQTGTIVSGIDREIAGKINKDLKALKLKVKVTIEDDKLRVTSAKIDLLQEVIGYLKEQDYGIPLQYVNYR
jgi:cyclic-di-GMP-binding protein